MITIKKQYLELHAILEANKNRKVSTILPELEALMAAKVRPSTSYKVDGEVVAIFCYYHKQYELLADVPYGKKASSTSGYNTMCKCGCKEWTAQQKKLKQIADDVMNEVMAGTIEVQDIKDIKDERMLEAKKVNQETMPVGYAELGDIPG